MASTINFPRSALTLAVEQSYHARALKFLSLTVFLLIADPLLNTYLGPVPLYGIDLMALITWILASRVRSVRRYPLQGYLYFITAGMIVSELVNGIRLGTLLEPTYLIGRGLVAFSLFYSTARLVRTRDDLDKVLTALLFGAIITSTLMVASSLPFTQKFVADQVFSHAFLMPSAENVAETYGSADLALRGQSLVGISILSAAFLNSIWPLLFLLRKRGKYAQVWRLLILFALIMVPIGVILSYSRGAIAGMVLIVIVALLVNSRWVRQSVVAGVAIAILLFSWVGWGSDYFKFEWLQEKSEYQFTNVEQSNDMTQRLYAYKEPFEVVRDHPLYLLIGEGFARDKITGAPPSIGHNVHAVFAAATYGYGMLTAFAYLFMLFSAFRITWRYAWGPRDRFTTLYAGALLAGLFGLSSWFLLGLAAVSEPRGAMLLFFVFGLVACLANLDTPAQSRPEVRDSMGAKPRVQAAGRILR